MSAPLKLLLIAPPTSVHTQRWVAGLRKSGLEVVTFGCDPFPPGASFLVKAWRFFALLQMVLVLRRQHRSLAPDLVHVHYASSQVVLARLAGIENYLVSVWGSDIYDFPRRSRLHRKLIEGNLRNARAIFSTSHAMAKEAAHYTSKPIEVVPFGVDSETFHPAARKERNEIILGTVKVHLPVYGIDDLIKAFALLVKRLPDKKLRLHIAGGGTEEVSLKALAHSLGISEICRFFGYIPQKQIVSFYQELDVAVFLSLAESFGVAVLEAGACAVPSLVTNVGGLPEVMRDGVTGRMVKPGDSQQAAQILEEMIADPQQLAAMGKAARDFVIQHFDWQENVRLMVAHYKMLVRPSENNL